MLLLGRWLSLRRLSLEAVPALLCCIYRCPWHDLRCIRCSRYEVLPCSIDTQHLRIANIFIPHFNRRCRTSLIHWIKTALWLSIVLDSSKFLLILLDLHNIGIQPIGWWTRIWWLVPWRRLFVKSATEEVRLGGGMRIDWAVLAQTLRWNLTLSCLNLEHKLGFSAFWVKILCWCSLFYISKNKNL